MASASAESSGASTAKTVWDPKGYVSIARRTAHGFHLCDQLGEGIGDLAAVILSFSKGLSSWSQAWRGKLVKNDECGLSVNSALLRLIEAVDSIGMVHSTVVNELRTNVVDELKMWQKANYRRNVMGKVKEATEVEADFATSQAPWNKLMKRQEKSKQKYYDLSKKVINTRHQETVARHDTSKSPDELEDLRNKIGRLESEQVDAKEAYRQTLEKLETHQQEYVEAMRKNYENADAIEKARLNYFASLVGKSRVALGKITHGKSHETMTQSLAMLETSISDIRVDEDLQHFRANFGVEVPFQLPPFEEYTETLHQVLRGHKLSKKLSSAYVGGGGGFKSLTSLKNHFKSSSATQLPSSVEDDDIEGFSTEPRVTTIRYLARESPRVLRSPILDANNNTYDGGKEDDDSNDEGSAENNGLYLSLDENVDSNVATTAPSAPSAQLKKTVSFVDVVEELSQRQEVARAGKQVLTVSPNLRSKSAEEGCAAPRDPAAEPSSNLGNADDTTDATADAAAADAAAAVDVESSSDVRVVVPVDEAASNFDVPMDEGASIGESSGKTAVARNDVVAEDEESPSPAVSGGFTPIVPVFPVDPVEAVRDDTVTSSEKTAPSRVRSARPKPAIKPRSLGRRSESETSESAMTRPALTLTQSTPQKEEGRFGDVNDTLAPYLVYQRSDSTATDPRLLDCGADSPMLTDEEEPELTLAGGGSVLGGHVLSFDKDLSLPGSGDTPMRVSTETKSSHRFGHFTHMPINIVGIEDSQSETNGSHQCEIAASTPVDMPES